MSWTIQIADDPDTTGEKTATATWTEVSGKVFSFTVRGKATAGAVNAFVVAAIAARNAWQAKNTTQATQEATVLARFVATDPQGG
jgi:hypothetical protein